LNTLEKRVQNTIAYLESDKGKINWQLNASRGYTDYMNTVAAIMTATHLIKYERIAEVLEAVRSIELVKGAA
jgi:hypothetical protein